MEQANAKTERAIDAHKSLWATRSRGKTASPGAGVSGIGTSVISEGAMELRNVDSIATVK